MSKAWKSSQGKFSQFVNPSPQSALSSVLCPSLSAFRFPLSAFRIVARNVSFGKSNPHFAVRRDLSCLPGRNSRFSRTWRLRCITTLRLAQSCGGCPTRQPASPGPRRVRSKRRASSHGHGVVRPSQRSTSPSHRVTRSERPSGSPGHGVSVQKDLSNRQKATRIAQFHSTQQLEPQLATHHE